MQSMVIEVLFENVKKHEENHEINSQTKIDSILPMRWKWVDILMVDVFKRRRRLSFFFSSKQFEYYQATKHN